MHSNVLLKNIAIRPAIFHFVLRHVPFLLFCNILVFNILWVLVIKVHCRGLDDTQVIMHCRGQDDLGVGNKINNLVHRYKYTPIYNTALLLCWCRARSLRTISSTVKPMVTVTGLKTTNRLLRTAYWSVLFSSMGVRYTGFTVYQQKITHIYK